ncbi:hypothetical protein [Streptomyces sp. JJ38]|uniref:hypothetical protein n=1 Tax=Streptomyces sp. JJ38 TaxID=2738128 RepID=UPI001C562962|nr:hypothetical protein [Streptomyces sp. JJ38]MBW1598118.1 hypothetical protein [Streptomyces sp. JJ38]
MWPGQQQPGGGQNPQEPNPYQQPGYQQPNPYQQPGQPGQPGSQPNPYQQPAGQGQWPTPAPPGVPQPPGGGKSSRRNTVLAIAVSLAVVAGAVVTGAILLTGDEDEGKPSSKDGDKPAASSSPSSTEPDPSEDDGGGIRDPDNPRGSGESDDPEPVVPGWQVVINPKHHSAFDVPEDWELGTKTTIIGWGEKEDPDAMFPIPQVAMSAPAYFKEAWCEDSDGGTYSRTVVGTKGAQGAKNTSEAALNAAQSFVYYRHGEEKDKVEWTESKPFKSDHGIEGHIAVATSKGAEKDNKCEADGKAVAVSWLDSSRELRLWVLITDTGVEDELSQAMIDKIAKSLRPYGEDE